MLGRKKKEVIISIESDGRIREFNTKDDASELYQIPIPVIDRALDSKEKINHIWLRRKADKVVSKNRILG